MDRRWYVLAVTKAHIKASRKYNEKNYKQLSTMVKPIDYELIDNYCKTNGISKAKLIVSCCKYCINNNVDILSIND